MCSVYLVEMRCVKLPLRVHVFLRKILDLDIFTVLYDLVLRDTLPMTSRCPSSLPMISSPFRASASTNEYLAWSQSLAARHVGMLSRG